MDPIEISIKYSFADYSAVAVDHAIKLLEGARSLARWPYHLAAVLLTFAGCLAWSKDFYALSSSFGGIALLVMLVTALTTPSGLRRFIPIVARVTTAFNRKLEPIYQFCIDDSGIYRRTRISDDFVPWDEVARVHCYTTAFLIELRQGAMPIPYRFLSATQTDSLRSTFKQRSLIDE